MHINFRTYGVERGCYWLKISGWLVSECDGPAQQVWIIPSRWSSLERGKGGVVTDTRLWHEKYPALTRKQAANIAQQIRTSRTFAWSVFASWVWFIDQEEWLSSPIPSTVKNRIGIVFRWKYKWCGVRLCRILPLFQPWMSELFLHRYRAQLRIVWSIDGPSIHMSSLRSAIQRPGPGQDRFRSNRRP